MANELFVTLVTSDNEYLKYPCRGWLELFELGTNGSVIVGVFRGLKTEEGHMGTSEAPVEVRNPMFVYDYKDTKFRKNR